MKASGSYSTFAGDVHIGSKKLLGILAAVFIGIAGLMIFQDYLESRRQGRSFYFSESFLFKTIWFLFIPILTLLYNRLKKQKLNFSSTTLFIIFPVVIHYLVLPFIFLFLSMTFYGGRYDLYKILTYTLANDLSVLLIVYSSFVLGYKYLSERISAKIPAGDRKFPETLMVNNGKDKTIINISEIVQIVAATPYVNIQLEGKKYLHTATLRSIHELLDPNDFIRVHKSIIVNIHKVISFRSRLNGDYDLQLQTGEKIRLSRTYAAGFKSALQLLTG